MQVSSLYPPVKTEDVSDFKNDLLSKTIYSVLETYSNVHRGSGQNSAVTTHLYEQAAGIILDYLKLNKRKYTVIFLTPARAEEFVSKLNPGNFKIISSSEVGSVPGLRAVAVKKNSLPKGVPFQSGGGTTRLYDKNWVIWSSAPDKFEAGTPAIVNVIAFAKSAAEKMHGGIDKKSSAGSKTVNEILYDDELNGLAGKELLEKLRGSVIGKDNKVPTLNGLRKFINLDNSASTRTFLPVFKSFTAALNQPAEVKDSIIAEVKKICAEVLGAPPEEYDIIFTSNTTESINILAKNLPAEKSSSVKPVILNTILEHSSNDLPWRNVPGYELIKAGIDKDGFYDLNELENIFISHNKGERKIRFAAVNGASNVLGSCNDIKGISKIVHKHGAYLFTDAAQLIAHRKVNMKEEGIDFLAFSGHKVYAPFGCGVLVLRKDIIKIDQEILEKLRLSGEENTAGIAALGKALQLLNRIGFGVIAAEEQELTRYTLKRMAEIPGIKIYGVSDPSSEKFKNKIGVVAFEVKGKAPGSAAKRLASERGIGVRYGCHCAHILIKYLLGFTPVLEKIQRLAVTLVPVIKLQGLVRVSFGIENTKADADELILALRDITAEKSTAKENYIMTKGEYKKVLKNYIRGISAKVYD